jgi:hypothetical protein
VQEALDEETRLLLKKELGGDVKIVQDRNGDNDRPFTMIFFTAEKPDDDESIEDDIDEPEDDQYGLKELVLNKAQEVGGIILVQTGAVVEIDNEVIRLDSSPYGLFSDDRQVASQTVPAATL